MALLRKFFYRKPPDGLLEISERVYVFDSCFTTDVLEEDEYKVYMEGIAAQLREHLPDSSFMVFNFREGETRSQISSILSEYDMTVMEYPRHYESCPILSMEMIHHFLRSSESWLSLQQQHVLLMHCERGGWPVLAFMLAALLIYRKQYSGEQKTLDMIYKQAPHELLQLMSPLYPVPSQLRYLQYVSRRNCGSEWPPIDRAITLDCVILRAIPNFDGKGGCCPIFRVYGQDPFMPADRTPKILYSMPKRSKMVQRYKQADCGLVKIDINCHIQGDVVVECISLHNDLEHEHMMFRVMFNTAFLRSNILMLNRDDIDILWNAKDQFPKDFRAEVIFSEMDTVRSLSMVDYSLTEGKEGLPVEAFSKVQEIFNNIDWLDPKSDVALDVLQKITASNFILEKLDTDALSCAVSCTDNEKVLTESVEEIIKQTTESKALEESDGVPVSASREGRQETFIEPSLHADLNRNQTEPQELQRASPPKIISQQVSHPPRSNPVSYRNALGSARPMSRYPSLSSMVGITALLHDHATCKSEEITSMTSSTSASTASPISHLEPMGDLNPVLPPASLQSLAEAPITTVQAPDPPHPPLKFPDHIQSKPIHTEPDHNNEASLHFGDQSTHIALPSSHFSSSLSHSIKGLHPTANLAPITTPQRSSPSVPSVVSSCLSKLSSIPPTPPVPPPLLIGASIKHTPRIDSLTSGAGLAQLTGSAVTIQPLSPSPPAITSSINKTGVLQLNKSTVVSSPPSPTLSSLTSSTTTLDLPQLTQPEVTVGRTPPSPPPPPPSGSTSSTTGAGLSQLTKSVVTIGPPLHPSQPPGATSSISRPILSHITKPAVVDAPPAPLSAMTSSTVGPGLLQLKSTITIGTHPPPLGITSSTTSSGLSQLTKSTIAVRPSPPPPPPPPAIPSATTCGDSSRLPKSTGAVCPPPPPPPPMHCRSSSANSTVSSTPPAPPPLPRSCTQMDPVLMNALHIPLAPPPPPPLCSGASSVNNAVSSAPPPPPPPSSATRRPASGNPSQVPPVPPPPGSLARGLSKTSSGSLQPLAATNNGNIPPIPAPPIAGKSKIQARPLARNQGQTKKSNLKPYHWLKLTRAMQGSLWAEAQKLDEASKAPEFDMKELENLFSAANTNSSSKVSGKAGASASKSEKIHLIEMRRAYNCEIMLSKVKVPLPDLMNSILALDEQALDIDQVDNLIKFCPTKEEMELLKGYKGEMEKLGKCEQFFLELMKVPRVESKLRVFSFKIQFRSQVSDLRKSLSIVNSTAEETRNSVKLKRIMQTILSLGNALNHGTARGSAIGFRLDSLLKLTDTRARNNKMTLMHYLCKVLCEKLPELLDFPKDLVSLEASTKIQLKYLAEEMQAISKGLEKVVQELTASETDGHVSDNFCKILKEFLGFAEAEVRSLASLYSSVGRNADALANYFGEDPAKCPFEQVVSTLLNFVRMFAKAQEDNRKQLELDKRKAEKEAESEKKKKEPEDAETKMKTGALRRVDSRKESMQSPEWSAMN